MIPNRSMAIDILLTTITVVLAVVTLWALVVQSIAGWVLFVSLGGLTLLAVGGMVARLITRPDHLRALQSERILEIANLSLAYLRTGLTAANAQAVCAIALERTEAAAVAVTDTTRVLGFAGLGEDHHEVGGPIMTRATREAVEHNEHRILSTREEIGCPQQACLLRAAIVVPLEMQGTAVGTLKFYYTTPRLLNETQITMAEGLAKLLSTQLELSELERQTELACRMELKALQAQINPHFLFNTINTIASLIRTDPPEARRLLREFAVFYRRTLESGEDLIPLSRELEYLNSYIAFEKARFGDRVVYEERIDPALLGMSVPAFIVQPIVENAIQHGMRTEEPLHIEVTSACDGADVLVCVVDDGVGIAAADLDRVLEPGFGKGLGIALKNVDDRLKGHFGPGSGVRVASTPGEGTTVSLVIAGTADAA